jgi:hypothetical protein
MPRKSPKRKPKDRKRALAKARRKSSPVPPLAPTRPRPQILPPMVVRGGGVRRSGPHEDDPLTGN